MAEETQKVWKVLFNVPGAELEDVLNAQVDAGLQAYRIDRTQRVDDIVFDIILFNPMLLGERASKKFTESVLAQIGASQAAGPAPTG